MSESDARLQNKIDQMPALVQAYNTTIRAAVARHRTLENQRTTILNNLAAKEQEIQAHMDAALTAFSAAVDAIRVQIDEDSDIVPAVIKVSEDEIVVAVGDDEIVMAIPGESQPFHYFTAPDPVTGTRTCILPKHNAHQITWRSEPVAPIPRA
jgi:hypothetical protein